MVMFVVSGYAARHQKILCRLDSIGSVATNFGQPDINLQPAGEWLETALLRQKPAVRLGKPLTIHTREAEEDTERILKAEVSREHRVSSPTTFVLAWISLVLTECACMCLCSETQIHIHCYTDSPEWAARMLAHFPNLYIGITGP